MLATVRSSPLAIGLTACPTRTPYITTRSPEARSVVANLCLAGTSDVRTQLSAFHSTLSPRFRSASATRTLSRKSICRTRDLIGDARSDKDWMLGSLNVCALVRNSAAAVRPLTLQSPELLGIAAQHRLASFRGVALKI